MPELIYHEILDSTLRRSLVRSGSSYTRYFYLFLRQKRLLANKRGLKKTMVHKKGKGPKRNKLYAAVTERNRSDRDLL